MFNEVNLFSGEEERNTWKDFFQSDFDFFFRFNVATDFLKRKNNKTKKLANFGLFFCFIFHPATNSDSDSNSGRLDASRARWPLCWQAYFLTAWISPVRCSILFNGQLDWTLIGVNLHSFILLVCPKLKWLTQWHLNIYQDSNLSTWFMRLNVAGLHERGFEVIKLSE